MLELERLCLGFPYRFAWAGTGCVVEDLAVNFAWLRAWVEHFPEKIPSGFFMTDVILELDRQLELKLLLPEEGTPPTRDFKIERARHEADSIKRLLQALRYLYRNGY